ncbi:hypothetical protein EJ06DRAFT_384252 [Trichodelitschia bisporula]|uniref:Uncharacterized protein n=1 Tax=Trichodelitschia bisporula TaxID=703511 RepID=A0A6G1HZH4_9PEZI|nr:hypothetical protein EJ06DRAFT_384252 [Trichodelitschia bisporula]
MLAMGGAWVVRWLELDIGVGARGRCARDEGRGIRGRVQAGRAGCWEDESCGGRRSCFSAGCVYPRIWSRGVWEFVRRGEGAGLRGGIFGEARPGVARRGSWWRNAQFPRNR